MGKRILPRPGIAARCQHVLLGLALIFAPIAARGAHFGPTRFEVSTQGLDIKGDLYGRLLPMSSLQVALARVVDLDQEPGYRPWIKTNGIGLPSYRSGWHRLKDREKALVFLTRSHLAVYVPTTLGYAVLITPDQPDALLAALRQPGAAPSTFRIAGE